MRGYVEQHVDPWRGPQDCAEQVADAARASALAERQRLARDLHDSVTQSLISLQLSAQAAVDLWDTQPAQAREALEIVRHLASGAAVEMRALLIDLHDAVLEQHGLVGALEIHGAVVRQRSGLQVEVRVGQAGVGAGEGPSVPPARLPAAYEEALYRLVQEALANVVKHARATHATVTLGRDTRVRVSVEDNGVGFGAPVPAFAYGLAGMRERVAALGGRLSLENRPGGGARVVADLPRPDEPGHRASVGVGSGDGSRHEGDGAASTRNMRIQQVLLRRGDVLRIVLQGFERMLVRAPEQLIEYLAPTPRHHAPPRSPCRLTRALRHWAFPRACTGTNRQCY
jgi:Histidine kinase/Histidine kinase-, DNA gyrase B-, and HSP90-like ATPase